MGLFFNVFVAAFSSIGAFLFGYWNYCIVITMNRYIDRFGDDPSIKGAVVSTFNGGCFFGAMGAGWTNDKLGRRKTIQIGCLFAIWGCAMQAGAMNVATLLIGRIIGGLAIGVLSMTVPLYNTEVAPPKIRGFLVGLTQQLLGIGFIVANWVGYGCQYINSDTSGAAFGTSGTAKLVPATLLLVGIQFLPNSPRWLLEVGRDEEAREVQEFQEMYTAIKAEYRTRSTRVSDLWATRPMLRRTLVAVGVQVFGQFTGINVINYYGPSMYESLGVTGGKALLVQGIYGAVGPIANLFFILFILDRVGRKKPLMFGSALFVATFSILSAIVATNRLTLRILILLLRAGIAMIFLTSVIFSLSFGPVSWVLASEVAPLGLDRVSWKFYILFIALNLVDFILISLFFPETKGKSLEQMNQVFGDEIVTAVPGSPNEKQSIEHA
ncbi:general substrate transporter [Cyathus striatus]|nr:general substrate transporter [Cyathus striatus]